MSCKQKCKKDRLIQINCSICLCSRNIEYSISTHLFHGWFQLLTLLCQMVTKSYTHLHNPAVERCRFNFFWHFGTTYHERANKIHVRGFPLDPARNYKIKKRGQWLITDFLTSFLFTLHDIYQYINNYFLISILRWNTPPV